MKLAMKKVLQVIIMMAISFIIIGFTSEAKSYSKKTYTDFLKDIDNGKKVKITHSVNTYQAEAFKSYYVKPLEYNERYKKFYCIKDINRDGIKDLIIRTHSFVHIYTQKRINKRYIIKHVISINAVRLSYDKPKYVKLYYNRKTNTLSIDNVSGFEATREGITLSFDKRGKKTRVVPTVMKYATYIGNKKVSIKKMNAYLKKHYNSKHLIKFKSF